MKEKIKNLPGLASSGDRLANEKLFQSVKNNNPERKKYLKALKDNFTPPRHSLKELIGPSQY